MSLPAQAPRAEAHDPWAEDYDIFGEDGLELPDLAELDAGGPDEIVEDSSMREEGMPEAMECDPVGAIVEEALESMQPGVCEEAVVAISDDEADEAHVTPEHRTSRMPSFSGPKIPPPQSRLQLLKLQLEALKPPCRNKPNLQYVKATAIFYL